jgi:hypothetical protein
VVANTCDKPNRYNFYGGQLCTRGTGIHADCGSSSGRRPSEFRNFPLQIRLMTDAHTVFVENSNEKHSGYPLVCRMATRIGRFLVCCTVDTPWFVEWQPIGRFLVCCTVDTPWFVEWQPIGRFLIFSSGRIACS